MTVSITSTLYELYLHFRFHFGPSSVSQTLKGYMVHTCTFILKIQFLCNKFHRWFGVMTWAFVCSRNTPSTDMPKPPEDDLFILPDEYVSCLRPKRSLLKSHRNEELNVETLVVVDRKMMQNHGHENITTYVLTILNMVGKSFLLKPRVSLPLTGCVRLCLTCEKYGICDDSLTLTVLQSEKPCSELRRIP